MPPTLAICYTQDNGAGAERLPLWSFYSGYYRDGADATVASKEGMKMLHAARIALIQTLQAVLANEQAMITKLRDRYIELDIERFAAELEAMEE